MNGVAIVICVNITMSCLYQIVPYMCSMYPLLWTIKKIVLDQVINTLRPRQDGRHFPDDTFKCFFLNEKI